MQVEFAAAFAQTQVLVSAAVHHQHPLRKDMVLEVHAKHAAELRRRVEKRPVRGNWRDQAKLDGCFYADVRGAIRGGDVLMVDVARQLHLQPFGNLHGGLATAGEATGCRRLESWAPRSECDAPKLSLGGAWQGSTQCHSPWR